MLKKLSLSLLTTLMMSFSFAAGYQITDLKIETIEADTSSDDEIDTKGISVSPAHFHLNIKPGQSKSYKIKINNDTESKKEFKVNMYDFNMNGKGKSSFLPAASGEYSLSKWMNVSPTFFEVKPGE
ncbi:MAG: hypothetical protein ACI85Q_002374, partial [Salibacteraceae bacterium]